MTKILVSLICSKIITARFVAVLLILPVISSATADTLQVAVSWAKPPYIIPKTHSGFEIELIADVFKDLTHDVNFIYMPYDRTIEMLQRKQTDVTLTLNNLSGISPKYLSDVYVFYQNVAVSLKSKNLPIQHIQDLSKHSVVGFQSASDVLGKEFAGAIENNNLYIEIADQRRQVELLFNEQVDVIIIDVNVFHYLSLDLTGIDQFEMVTVHSFFAQNHYSAGFKDMTLKNQFNQSLAKYKSSGRYNILKAKYNFKDIKPIIK
jgi:polar amino acid transport system substrate-binding protein